MFIELSEMLRCPGPHEETPLVVATEVMEGRSVRRGVVGCPACGAEYPIHDGIIRFGEPPRPRDPHHVAEADTLAALLGLGGPGGYVALVGAACRRAEELAALLDGIHFVGINAPPGAVERDVLSLLESDGMIPLRTGMARGVVVGGDFANAPWLDETARVVLPGRHVVVEREGVEVDGLTGLATGRGLWLGARD